MSCHLHTPRVTPTLAVHAPQRSPSQNHAPRALHPREHPHHPPVQTSHALACLHIHQPNSTHEPIATAYSVTFPPSPDGSTRSRYSSWKITRHRTTCRSPRRRSACTPPSRLPPDIAYAYTCSLSLVDTHKHPCGLSQQTIQVDNIPSTSSIVLAPSRPLTKSPSHRRTCACSHRRTPSPSSPQHRHSLNSSSPGYTHHSITLAHTAL